MIELIKEQKELIKNQIIDFLNDEIDNAKHELRLSWEACNKSYYEGSLDAFIKVKRYLKEFYE